MQDSAPLLPVLLGLLIPGLFSIALLFLRRRTEREQLNGVVVESASVMLDEYRKQHTEDVGTIAALRDEVKGLRQEIAARDVADVPLLDLLERLKAENAALKARGDEQG